MSCFSCADRYLLPKYSNYFGGNVLEEHAHAPCVFLLGKLHVIHAVRMVPWAVQLNFFFF